MHKLLIDPNDKLPKIKQIVQALIRDIEKGILKKDERLPSITDFSKQHKIARDTVEKAYSRLKEKGFLISVPGKGNYVAERLQERLKILMVLNKMSSYKKEVYYSFLRKLGLKAKVDLQIHHYDPKLLKEIVDQNKGKYHYYVIMPHFFHDADPKDYMSVLKSIPSHELVILDKNVVLDDDSHIAVYQDFKLDIYEALLSAEQSLQKYKSITIVFPELNNHPTETLQGIKQFCKEYKKKFLTVSDVKHIQLKKGQVYLTLTESALADLIKMVRSEGLKLGTDVGIISFNETVLKELLDITVITTNFEEMGITAANLILNKEFKQVRNSCKLIERSSL